MADCNCSLHQLTKEERTILIDAAIDRTIEEAKANGGVLPIETFMDDLTKEIVDRIWKDLEDES